MAAVTDDDDERASPLSGLWAGVVGGLLIVVLLLFLDPVSRVEECSNYGAAGNASAFDDSRWDLLFPLVVLGWITLTIMEQALPVTWRGRSRTEGWVRAGVAVMVSTTAGCCLALGLAVACR
jgi:hypothetical protein